MTAACPGGTEQIPSTLSSLPVASVEPIREADVRKSFRSGRGYYPERLRGARLLLNQDALDRDALSAALACARLQALAGTASKEQGISPFVVRGSDLTVSDRDAPSRSRFVLGGTTRPARSCGAPVCSRAPSRGRGEQSLRCVSGHHRGAARYRGDARWSQRSRRRLVRLGSPAGHFRPPANRYDVAHLARASVHAGWGALSVEPAAEARQARMGCDRHRCVHPQARRCSCDAAGPDDSAMGAASG